MSDKKVEPFAPSLEANGQWSLAKTKQVGNANAGLARGDWFHSGNDGRRKRLDMQRAQEAEEMKEEKEKAAEEARVADITNPFTGQVDQFAPGQADAHRQRMDQLSAEGASNRSLPSSSEASVTPKLAYQQRAVAQAQADASNKAAQDKNHADHMEAVLSGKKPPATVWEKAAVVAHMKAQMNAPQPVAAGPSSVKPQGRVIVRKKGEAVNKSDNGQWSLKKASVEKSDSEMAFGDITELLHHIKELKSLLKPEDELPDWVKAKLTLATDYLSTVAHFVDGAKEAGRPLNKAKGVIMWTAHHGSRENKENREKGFSDAREGQRFSHIAKIKDPGSEIKGALESGKHEHVVNILRHHPKLTEEHVEEVETHPKSSSKVLAAAGVWRKKEGFTKADKLDILKGELVQLKEYMKPKVSDPAKGRKLVADAKAMGEKNFKDKMKSLAKEEVEKADNVMDYSKLKSMTTSQIQRQNEASVAAQRSKLYVGQGSGKDLQVGSAPRLSGIAGKYEMGKTRTGKPVMSHPEHAAHAAFSAQDHNDAMAFHKQKRDEFKDDPGVNKDLVAHHQNAAEFHSKASAQLRAASSGIK